MLSPVRFFLTLSLGSALLHSASVPVPAPALDPPATAPGPQTAVLSGGCFWGVDAVFKHVKGVTKVVSGYAGGTAATANDEQKQIADAYIAQLNQARPFAKSS